MTDIIKDWKERMKNKVFCMACATFIVKDKIEEHLNECEGSESLFGALKGSKEAIVT